MELGCGLRYDLFDKAHRKLPANNRELLEQSFFFTAFAVLGSVVGAYGVAQVKSRSEILKAGARVGLMNAALVSRTTS